MRIAVFTDLYLEVPGGIPSSVRAQKAELERLGHKVTVFCPGFRVDEDGVVLVPTFKWLRINGAPIAKWPKTVEKWMMREYPDFGEKFDVVHVHHEMGTSIAGIKHARKFGLPVVQTMHGREDMAIAVNVWHPFKTLVALVLCFIHGRSIPHTARVRTDSYLAPTVARAKMWTLMVAQANAADIVVMPSKHFIEKFRHYGVTREMIKVSNGVADELVVREWPVRKLEVDGKLRMIWTSRLSKEKRIVPFLMALSLIRDGNWEIEVYGKGNELAKVERIVKRLDLSKRVYLRGSVSHSKLMEALKSAHLAVLASYGFDNQAMTLLEAEAVGLPVFYCDPDMKEVVPRTGAVIAKGPRPEEMAEAIAMVVAEPGRVEEMSRAMLERRGEVAQSIQVKRLLGVYEKAMRM